MLINWLQKRLRVNTHFSSYLGIRFNFLRNGTLQDNLCLLAVFDRCLIKNYQNFYYVWQTKERDKLKGTVVFSICTKYDQKNAES